MALHPPGRTALYRFFNAAGQLLYVGISNDPEARWKAHRWTHATWCPLVANRKDEWFDTRAEAEAAEVAAIKTEKPQFNGTHNFIDAPFTPSVWSPAVTGPRKREVIAARVREEINSGNWEPGMRIPSASQIAAACGISLSTATKAVGPFIRAGLLEVQGGRGVFVARQSTRRPKLPHDWPRRYGFPG